MEDERVQRFEVVFAQNGRMNQQKKHNEVFRRGHQKELKYENLGFEALLLA